MPNFIAYEESSGRVMINGYSKDPVAEYTRNALKVLIVDGLQEIKSQEHYVVDEEVSLRPSLNIDSGHLIAIDQEVILGVGLPAHTLVRMNGSDMGEVEDGILAFSASTPGRYTLELTPPFPFKQHTVEVFVQ